LCCAFIVASHVAFANTTVEERVDSLKSLIETQTDTLFIGSIIILDNYINTNSPRESLDYLKRALDAADELGHDYYRAELKSLMGVCHYSLAEFDIAKTLWLEALEICEMLVGEPEYLEMRTKLTHSTVLSNLGVLYKVKGDYVQALDYYQKSLEIRKRTGSKHGVGICYLNIGNIYTDNKNDQLALSYYLKAEELFEEIDNFYGLASVLNNVALIYQRQKNFELAKDYFNRALDISAELNDRKRAAIAYGNLGALYKEFNDCDKALDYYSLALIIRKEIEDKLGIAYCYQHIAECYVVLNKDAEALSYFEKAMAINEELQVVKGRLECLKGISELNYKLGDYKLAYEFKHKYTLLNDSVYSNELQIKLAEQEAGYETREKEKQIAIKDLEIEKQQAELARQNTFKWLLVFGLLLLAAVFIIYIQRFRIVSNLKIQLETQNKELKQTYDELSKTVVSKEEKEVMLKEIHHRVKNNLQIISSLINFQANSVTDPKVCDLFRECQNRIYSMSMLHEQLYKAKDLASVNIEQYFSALLENLLLIFSNHTKIEVDLDIEVDSFGVDTLIPIGLLLNEIVSNSLKYAFVGREEGLISISLKHQNDNCYELIVADNGVGITDTQFPETSDSLGLELIQTFISQLDGEVQVSNENGTSYTIKFYPVIRSK
jgi:two-component sensor histidine kinase/Tfp pilus assembly protein PilF